MVTTPRIAVLAAAALLFWPLARAWPQDSSRSSNPDSAAIRRLFAEFDRSFSRHDARGVAMTFSEDADFTNMRGMHRRGRMAIEQWMAGLFAGVLRDTRRTDTVRSIRFLTPRLAAVDADTVITGTRSAGGSVIPPRKGLMITVMSKQNGRWLIRLFHEAEYPPPAPAPAR
jgi:uncharacterized protein (TIGR02246 family)